MVLTLSEVELNKVYRIRAVVNMQLKVSQRLEKEGVTTGFKIRVVDRTSYGFHLIEVIHPNGSLIKTSIPNEAADRIHVEWIEDYNQFMPVGEK